MQNPVIQRPAWQTNILKLSGNITAGLLLFVKMFIPLEGSESLGAIVARTLPILSRLSVYMPSGAFIRIAMHSHTLGVKLKAVILKQTEEMMCVYV